MNGVTGGTGRTYKGIYMDPKPQGRRNVIAEGSSDHGKEETHHRSDS